MYLVEILNRCSEIEGRTARLYRKLAKRFQGDGMARLWRELALEEETHADILQRERRAFESEGEMGAFLPEYTERIDHADRLLDELEDRIRELGTIDDAATFAVAIEQTELEDLYDDLVTQGHPAFKLISERLEAALFRKPAQDIPGVPRHMAREKPKP